MWRVIVHNISLSLSPRFCIFFVFYVYYLQYLMRKKLQYSIAFLKVAPSLVNEQRPQRYRYIGASFIFRRLRLTTRLRSVAYHVMQSSWRQPHQSTAAAAASEVAACSVRAVHNARVTSIINRVFDELRSQYAAPTARLIIWRPVLDWYIHQHWAARATERRFTIGLYTARRPVGVRTYRDKKNCNKLFTNRK